MRSQRPRAVRQFATSFAAREQRLDVLVNNAGALSGRRTLSAEGIESTFATNVLGPFLLTNMLVPLLAKSAPARIINVSSGGVCTQRIHVDDRQRVMPTRRQRLGYRFSYPELEPALRALVAGS